MDRNKQLAFYFYFFPFTLPLHTSTLAQWLGPSLGCGVQEKSNYNIHISSVDPILSINIFYSFFYIKNLQNLFPRKKKTKKKINF